MDDQHFDNHIKGKLAGFETELDYAAISNFRSLMDDEPLPAWWKRWIKRLGWLLLLLLLLLNGFMVWSWRNLSHSNDLLRAELGKQMSTHSHISSVDTVYLSGRVDTIYMAEYKTPPAYQNRFSAKEGGIANRYTTTSSSSITASSSNLPETQPNIDIGLQPGESKKLNNSRLQGSGNISLTGNDGGISKQQNGPVNSEVNSNTAENKTDATAITGKSTDTSLAKHEVTNDESSSPLDSTSTTGRTLSPTAQKLVSQDSIPPELTAKEEKQAHREQRKAEKIRTPFGIILGLEGNLFQPIPEVGEGKISSGIGIMTEFILSKHWRLRTGFDVSRPRYDINLSEHPVDLGFSHRFPSIRNDLGELQKIRVRSNSIEIPLQLKYFFDLNDNNRLFLGTGWNPSIYWYQYFSNHYIQNGVEVTNEHEETGIKINSGSVLFNVGFEKQIATRFRWQASGYYSQWISSYGYEGMQMNFWGIRSSFWFDLK